MQCNSECAQNSSVHYIVHVSCRITFPSVDCGLCCHIQCSKLKSCRCDANFVGLRRRPSFISGLSIRLGASCGMFCSHLLFLQLACIFRLSVQRSIGRVVSRELVRGVSGSGEVFSRTRSASGKRGWAALLFSTFFLLIYFNYSLITSIKATEYSGVIVLQICLRSIVLPRVISNQPLAFSCRVS